MYTRIKRELLKTIVSLSIIFTILLTFIVPIWAIEFPTPDISPWALITLNEGERYGIYTTDWYYDGFREEISQERLELLLENTAGKIEALELDKNEHFTPISSKGDRTREDVLIRLYNILAQYDIPVGDSHIDYMLEKNILRGTGSGLDLNSICTTEQAVVFATRLIEDTYNLLDAGAKGLAWKVEHNGNTVYLLGSIHAGNSLIYPINDKLKEAFYESDALLVEANILNMGNQLEGFIELITYQDGTTLKDHISEKTYQKLLQVSEIYGMPIELFEEFKPWSIAITLETLSMTDIDNVDGNLPSAILGIDLYFMSHAQIIQMPIIELEGLSHQSDLFDNLSSEFQDQYLNKVLDNILNPSDDHLDSVELLEEWLNQWKDGDIEGFTESYLKNAVDTEDEISNMLFGERDRNMAEKIIDLLESEEKGTYFVVVGAGHFVVPDTIIYQLKDKGYNVEVFNY
ncbi:TraB/GumN family protein [Tepidimicrobium xylanilyticum]